MNTTIFNNLNWDEICIIDDSAFPGMVTLKLCETHVPGVPVRLFDTVDKAMHYLNTFVRKRRIIFVDLHMPHKNGFDFLDLYKPSSSEKIYILSSSGVHEEISVALNHETVEDFIRKPMMVEQLLTIVNQQQVSKTAI